MRRGLCIIFAFLFLTPSPGFTATHQVPGEFATIQAGIDACAEGDTVLVAPGTYTGEGNRDLDFGGVNLSLIGAAGPEATIIDCEDECGGFAFTNGETLASLLRGFTITKGRGAACKGGAILCDGASPSFENLILCENGMWCFSTARGGAVYLMDSQAMFTDVVFRNNFAVAIGDCVSAHGGGLCSIDSSPVLVYVLFDGNNAESRTYGIESGTQVYGGGMYSEAGRPELYSVVFKLNAAICRHYNGSAKGSGLYIAGDMELDGVSFAGNQRASTLYCGSEPSLSRVLIAFNEGGSVYSPYNQEAPQLTCSNIFGNSGGDWVGDLASQLGANWNISEDPLLCAMIEDDLYLSDASPCLPENNGSGLLIGARGQDCFGLAPDNFTATCDRSDGVELVWEWASAPPFGFRILRDQVPIYETTDPIIRTWLDTECSVDEHTYSLRAMQTQGDGPSVYAQGERLPVNLEIISPNGDEVLHFGEWASIDWLPDSGTWGSQVRIEVSRNGAPGPWEVLFEETAHDGHEDWLVTGKYSLNCLLRIIDPSGASPPDYSDAVFKIGTKTTRVPEDAASIAAALAASAEQDTVLLSPGTYVEHDLNMTSDAVLLGDELHPEDVVIDAQGLGRIMVCCGCDTSTVVAGITFSNGVTSQYGAAIYSSMGNLYRRGETIRNCRFINNHAETYGGAIASPSYHERTKILSCYFEGNSAGTQGGGIWLQHNAQIEDCIFVTNHAPDGGAIYSKLNGTAPSHCIFRENTASNIGGAIAIYWAFDHHNTPIYEYCLFEGNHCAGNGGALGIIDFALINIENCSFVDNAADGLGGAIFAASEETPLQIARTLIVGSTDGAAIACEDDGTNLILECCDIFGNAGGDWVGCIADQAGINGNMSVDPIFCDEASGDFRLDAASPCLPENNECGALIGALGQGCEDTPVLLSAFDAVCAQAMVTLSWELEAGSSAVAFRLEAKRDEAAWTVDWTETAPACFTARDENPLLIPGVEVEYALYGREGGLNQSDPADDEWQFLRKLSVLLPSPAAITELGAPYPNPFNPQVMLPFSLAKAGRARLNIYDLSGRLVRRLADDVFPAGPHELAWDGKDAAGTLQSSGVYFVRFDVAGSSASRRLILLR